MENEENKDDSPSQRNSPLPDEPCLPNDPPSQEDDFDEFEEKVKSSNKHIRSDKLIPYISRGKLFDSIELLTAAKKEDFATVNQILTASKELDLDSADEVGKTALHYLSNLARVEEIDKYLRRKCDINKADKLGWTALHYAALKGHTAVAQVLVNFGANCNAADKQQGRTPLHYAVSRDNRGLVDLLLECGADPEVKDNHNKKPSDICKNELMKSTLDAAIQRIEEEQVGAVCETLNISPDKPTPFSQLCLTVEPKSNSNTPAGNSEMSFKMSMRRISPANCSIDFGISETEDLCSDVFTYKTVGKTPDSLLMDINIPVTSGPENNEEMVLKTDTGQEITAHGVKEENEKLFCNVTADMKTFHSFVVICRTITERFQVGHQACKIQSALDDRVEMDITKGTFNSKVTLSMEILNPPQEDQMENVLKACPDLKSTSSFYTLESEGFSLLKPINVKVPLTSNYKGSENFIILSMDDSPENEKPESWKVISRGPKLKNERVEFDVGSFSIKVAVETASTISDDTAFELERPASIMSQISRVFRKARRKEYQVMFVCLTRRLGTTNTFKVVVECCKEHQTSARLAHWEAEGFERQGTENNATPISVKAKDKFQIMPRSLNVLDKKGDIGIEFHPKLDNQVAFIVKLVDDKLVSFGTLEIWQPNQRPDSSLGDSSDGMKTKTFTVNLKLAKFDPRLMEQDKSFLSYQRLLTLLETIGDRWWKMLILIGVPFQVIDKTLQNNPGNVDEKVNGMFFDWREKHRDERSRGLPLLFAALCKSGMRGVTTDLQIVLRKWKNDPNNKTDSFKEWLLMAYKFDLLMPTVYEKPMADGFLAMLADQIEPSISFASALNLPEGLVRDILAKTNVYPVKGLQTMKMLDMFRVGVPDKEGALAGLAEALTKAGMKQQHRYLIMTTTAWLRKASVGDPMANDVERFLGQLTQNSS